MKRITIGIDTGLDGGITILENGAIKSTHVMPTFETPTAKKSKTTKKPLTKRNVDAKKLADILSSFTDANVFIEDVHSLHKVSAASNFSMGQANGIAQGVVRGFAIDYYLVKFILWQKEIWTENDMVYEIKDNKKKRNTKATSLNAANRIFPGEKFLRTSKCSTPHDGMFDSALIAKYGDNYILGEQHA